MHVNIRDLIARFRIKPGITMCFFVLPFTLALFMSIISLRKLLLEDIFKKRYKKSTLSVLLSFYTFKCEYDISYFLEQALLEISTHAMLVSKKKTPSLKINSQSG